MKNTLRDLVLASLATTCAVSAQTPENGAAQERDIVQTAVQAGSFETLATALQAADLVDALSGPGPFTVFAPTDEAFTKLPDGALQALLQPANRERLRSILQYHVIAGRVDAVSALRAGRAQTLLGEPVGIRLDGGRLRVQDANIVQTDIGASNGVIHVIDSVLLPPAPPAGPGASASSPVDRSRDLLLLAIERGVPLFNDRQPEACAAIYEIAVRAVLDLGGELPERAEAALRTAVQRADGRAPVDRAWALRFGMDRALNVFEHEAESSARSDDSETTAGLDFSTAEQAAWRIVNDDVMGGISKSSFRATNNETVVFTGRLSLENNGGFASVRSPEGLLDLSGAEAVLLRVKGDGRTYAFQAMRSDRRGEFGYWEYSFPTVEGEWTEVVVPLDELVAKIMGRRIPNAGVLAPERIGSIAFMIADKDTTPFRLEIDEIRPIRSGS